MSVVALVVVEAAGLDVRPLVLLTSAQLAVVYAVGVAAAIRLLPAHSRVRAVAVVAAVAVLLLLVAVGPYLIWPAALAVIAATFVHRRRLRRKNLATLRP